MVVSLGEFFSVTKKTNEYVYQLYLYMVSDRLMCELCIFAVVFISGSGMYVKAAPQGNIMLDVSKCIGVSMQHEKKDYF